MQIRAYKSKDLDKCVDMFIKAFREKPWGIEWPSFQKAKSYIKSITHMPGFMGVVLEDNNKILGMIIGHQKDLMNESIFFVEEMCVDVAHQRKGYGEMLMNQTKKLLLENNVTRITLMTKERVPAVKFYQEQGFNIESSVIFMYNNLY